jgi:hypothetical protein
MDQPAEEGDRQDDKQKDDHMDSIAGHGLKIAIFPAMDKGGIGQRRAIGQWGLSRGNEGGVDPLIPAWF